MNRAVTLIMAISSAVLLGGCGPHWDDGERYGRYYDHDHRRGYDQRGDDDQGEDRQYDRHGYYRGGYDRDHRRYRDRDDNDD